MDQDPTGQRNSREGGETPTAVLKFKTEGGSQTMGVRRNGGQERMLGVDKMDTEGNSQKGKLEGGIGVGLGVG